MFNAQVTGRLTADPVVREGISGQTYVTFGVADNRRWTDRSTGEQRESVTFVNCVANNANFPANLVASLHKGDFVIVQGNMVANDYEQAATSDAPLTRVKGYRLRVDFVGPDLRFQSAPVTRNERAEVLDESEEAALVGAELAL